MKYLLVLVVVIVVAWVMLGRSRGRGDKSQPRGDAAPKADAGGAEKAAGKRSGPADAALTMVACSHCGLHLPRADAVADAQGRLFCEDAHRLAGPR